jgi:hypothetical protein
MKTPTCVTSTRLPEIAMADLSLDKWRPISVDKFLATRMRFLYSARVDQC